MFKTLEKMPVATQHILSRMESARQSLALGVVTP